MNHAAINALVAERVMGWPVIDEDTPFHTVREYGGFICNGVPEMFGPIGIIPVDHFDPSRNIAHAMEVLDHIVGPCYYHIHNGWTEGESGKVRSGHNCRLVLHHGEFEANGSTPALAICLAALRAVGVTDKDIEEVCGGG